MSGSSRPSTKEISTRKDFLIPRHLGINQLIIEDETPVEYRVTFAIGDLHMLFCFFNSEEWCLTQYVSMALPVLF